MASTYENDLRLEEMATGENSGSWGTKTNTNLELVADAFSYGTETIADADTAITIADGAADAARSLALKINSSEDLTTTRVVTLGPNTTSKVWIIENNTSGGQTLTISAGSGSNITLANGTTKIIATDGIGAGSNVVELTQDIAIADLSVDGILSLADGTNSAPSLTNTGDTNTGLYFPAADEVGITVGGTQVLKADSTGIDVTGTITFDGGSTSANLTFGDNDKAIFGAGSNLQIYHDGTHNYIEDTSTGNLYIQGTNLILKNQGGTENLADFVSNGAVTLYYDNAPKLATESGGVNLTGTLTSDGLTVDGASVLNENLTVKDSGSPTITLTSYPGTQDTVATIFSGRADFSGTDSFLRFGTNDGTSTKTRLDISSLGDITFFDTSGNASFVYDESAGSTFNEQGDNKDFRVESAISTHAIFLDAENGKTGINNAGPFTPLDVNGYTSVHSSNDAGQLYLVREQSSISGDNIIGRLSFSDTDGVTNGDWTTETHAPVMIQGVADEAHGASDRGGRLEIWTKDNNSATTDVATKKFQISHNGTTNVYSSFLGVNGTDPVLRLNATNTGGGSGNPQLEFYRDSALYGSIEFIPNVEMRLTSHNAVGSLNFHAYGDNQRLSLGASAVFNDPGNDYDFRVESNNNANMLFVNAGDDTVYVGKAGAHYRGATRTFELAVDTGIAIGIGASAYTYGLISDEGTQGDVNIIANAYPANLGSDRHVRIKTGSAGGGGPDEIANFGASTGAVFNDNGQANKDFRVESDSKSHALFVDASTTDVYFGASSTSYPTGANFVHINEQSAVSMVIGGHSGTHTVVQFRHNGANTVGSIVVDASSTSYNTSSDYRLKENVVYDWDATTRLKQLKPARFNFIVDDTNTLVDGFLAHEAQAVVPEAVSGTHNQVNDNGDAVMQGIDQSKLVPLLVKTIQELEARITALENA